MSTEATAVQNASGVGDSASFERHLSLSALPEKWKKWKSEYWEKFESLPLPRNRDEHWRFAKRIDFELNSFQLPEPVSDENVAEALSRSELVTDRTSRIVFVDNQLVHQEPIPQELVDQGVVFMPIAEAMEKKPELVERYLFQESTDLGSDKFHALHNAYSEGGYILYVPKNVEIDAPFVTYHWQAGPGAALFPHILVAGGANSRFSVVDVQQSLFEDREGFSCAVGNVFAEEGAKIFRKTIQNFNTRTVSFQLDTNNVDRDTAVRGINLNLGSRRARFENEVRINGAGSDVKLYSLTVSDNDQEFDQRTLQIHNAPNSVSDLLYKNALMDESRTIFSGLIKVAKDAQGTDAYQTNRNLLLNDTAQANSLPGLEIEANDVKCSHGATTGQLDRDELFYFLQRGISKMVAQQLMVFGFFEEVIEQFDNEELEENLRGLIRGKFEKKQLDAVAPKLDDSNHD
ncbi:Fe-S cluster assembly protein SufD [Puniceicoccus vermicola]|uniref:Fe-S cluster assembly protein SufD n=1 Tax=Puniceicoccus vermicola TaxID=388746 RepID=A0A7X1AWX5_9BACT|nr:Fe-S cluster assembly protein SufD [Puniceicoccus vermicola]MBC2601394.1 Fe-S cluster assembly protein SufD [Puniceicoccus vermicola]